jgi:hypothetical protein
MSTLHILLTLLPSVLLAGEAAAVERPNVVLIYADDMGWGGGGV